jgi:hypothetical protein
VDPQQGHSDGGHVAGTAPGFPDPLDSPAYTFDAFVSYRRSDGTRAARRLRRRLRDFRLPTSIRRSRPTRSLSIYLDTIYERAEPDFFEETIKPALRASKHLIVVQTPNASKRRTDGRPNWVEREIEFFRTLPQRNNISVALAKGTIDDPLPFGLERTFPNIERVDVRELASLGGRLSDETLIPFVARLWNVPPERRTTAPSP